jgi:xanthosine utilization system XapX-like protein
MTEKSRRNVTHRSAVERVRNAETFAVTLPVVGQVRIPRPDQLAYYGALAGLAALEIIDWPIALVIGAGHALAASQHHKVAQELGEALQDA